MNKKPWLSKTIWLNAVAGVSALVFPAVGEWISANVVMVASIWSVLGIGLRLITKDKIQLIE